MMKIVLLGLNHQTAPVEIREKLAMDEVDPAEIYQDLRKLPAIQEVVYFSTCNRVEFIFTTHKEIDVAADDIKGFLSSRKNLPVNEFEEHLYLHEGAGAIEHLFKVASSLDSMVVGEPQILGQVKAAYRHGLSNKSSGVVLNKIIHKSFSVAKKIRSETGIASQAVSISYAAVELARKIFGKLAGTKVLLVGAGEMIELAARNFMSQDIKELTVANRTLERAIDLAAQFDGQAIKLEEIPSALVKVDIVLTSTGATEPIITMEMVKKLLKARKHRPLFFVDIAVPRDVDPKVNNLENVYLYDIDDLNNIVKENLSTRSGEAIKAGRIVEEETIKITNWLKTFAAAPTIIAIRNKAEEIRQAELKKTMSRLGELTPEQVEALEILTKSLAHKIIHDPIIFLKNSSRKTRKSQYLDMARQLFNLDPELNPGLTTSEDEDGEQQADFVLGPEEEEDD